MSDTTTETTIETLIERIVVDVMPGMVIRPGDVLVLSSEQPLSAQETHVVREVVKAKLPGIADVLIVAAPLQVAAVYREAREGET